MIDVFCDFCAERFFLFGKFLDQKILTVFQDIVLRLRVVITGLRFNQFFEQFFSIACQLVDVLFFHIGRQLVFHIGNLPLLLGKLFADKLLD